MNIPKVIEGRDVAIQEGFVEWTQSGPTVLCMDGDGFRATIYPGAPDRGEQNYGYTLHWEDQVINEWAEHYSDLGTTIARLAALVRGAEEEAMFQDGPIGFVRWSENFFRQTITPSRLPH